MTITRAAGASQRGGGCFPVFLLERGGFYQWVRERALIIPSVHSTSQMVRDSELTR